MSSDIVINVEEVSKCFQIYNRPRDRLKQFILPKVLRVFRQNPRQYFREFWALKDISFKVRQGETWGVLGKNGSGKSTLLQILCGTLTPTHGAVRTSGRVTALLELGSGFNPEFTGRENVFMNGAVHGFTHEEMQNRFDDIAAFADIGDFIEQPVRTYSSGMFVRLAFAVNVLLDPDILVVDEALSVGDAAFQARCMTMMRHLQNEGVALLLVSHDIRSVRSLCHQAIYLENGQIKNMGKSAYVTTAYTRDVTEQINADIGKTSHNKLINLPPAEHGERLTSAKQQNGRTLKKSASFDERVALFRGGTGYVRITFVELLDMDDNPVTLADFNQEVKCRLHFYSKIDGHIVPVYYILDEKRNCIMGGHITHFGLGEYYVENGGEYIATFTTKLPLVSGDYSIMAQIERIVVPNVQSEFYDRISDAVLFSVNPRSAGVIWTSVFVPGVAEVERINSTVEAIN
jgi:lipopolysaccharide transport system ATP-binding protein